MSDSTQGGKERAVLDLFGQTQFEPLTTSELVTKAEWSRQTVSDKLDALVAQGHLKTKEVGTGEQVWWRPPHVGGRDEPSEPVVTPDVTAERRETGRTLFESESRFREMIDALPEAVYTTDVEGRLTHYNPAAEEFSGRTPELGTDEWCVTWKLFWPDGTPMPHDECPMAVALKEGRSIRGAEAIAEQPDGTRIWFEAYPSPLRDDDGEIVGGINMLVDVTERKRTERLQEAQTRLLELIASGTSLEDCLSALCDAVPQLNPGVRASILLADDSRETFDRHIAPDVFPSSSENLEGAPINDLAIGTCGEAVFHGKPVTAVDIETDEKWSKNWRELCLAHDVRACHSRPVMDPDGQPIASFMLCFDEPREPNEWEQRLADFGSHVAGIALERDRSRQSLREREEYLSALVETAPQCIKTVSADGTLLQMNPAGLDMVEADSEADVIGECLYDLVAPEHRETFREFNERVCQGESGTLEFDIVGLEGTRRHMETHAAPLHRPDGTTVQIALTHDITERKNRVSALEESNKRLEQFAHAASHDLQEPLRMVSSYLQMIDRRYEEDLDDDGQEFLEFAVDGADRMRNMIQGLLEYSRVETHGNSFAPTDLNVVLTEVREDLQMRIEESDAEITADSLPSVDGDKEQLRQVFQNLLDNAIEYSGAEPPRVDVSAERDGSEWIISVSDAGIGIDSDEADHVFEVFESLHPPDEHTGTGIGLALCERIVERHDGDIWAESGSGDGSTFSFRLPAVSAYEN